MSRQTNGGFSTIEVLVAMAVLAAGLIPLIQVGIDAQRLAQHADRQQMRAEAIINAISYYRTVNVGVRPKGEERFGGWELEWESQLLADDLSFEHDSPTGSRQIGLYQTRLIIRYETLSGTQAEEISVRSLGWSAAAP